MQSFREFRKSAVEALGIIQQRFRHMAQARKALLDELIVKEDGEGLYWRGRVDAAAVGSIGVDDQEGLGVYRQVAFAKEIVLAATEDALDGQQLFVFRVFHSAGLGADHRALFAPAKIELPSKGRIPDGRHLPVDFHFSRFMPLETTNTRPE